MVGGGEDYELIRNFVNNKELNSFVIFTGKIHPDQVKYYYKLADVTVDPVFADIAAKARSPLKLFESVICGTPILTMAVGDRNVLKNISKKIIIVEDFKPKIIAEKIKLVIDLGYRDLEEISIIKTYFWNNLVVRFVSFLKGIYEPQ
jgi:glycosyltransferase involved in cell wall biosynthesis